MANGCCSHPTLSGHWNLHAYDESGVYCLLPDDAEYAGPAWQFAASYFVPVGPSHVVARRVEDARSTLVVIDVDRGLASPLHDGCCSYAALTRTPAGVAYVAGYPDQPGRVEELKLDTRTTVNVAMPDAHRIGSDVISVAETITFPSTDDETGMAGEAHAYFYPPRNGASRRPAGRAPAPFDHHPRWPDVECQPGAQLERPVLHLARLGRRRRQLRRQHGLRARLPDAFERPLGAARCRRLRRLRPPPGRRRSVDPARVAIRGGSAGGYTTLAALAFTDVFRAGASHYGVGDLVALDRDTHKFESRYLGTLVGDADAMRARSPVNHVDRLNCPVIFFQGTEDRIVPPNQAEAMRDVLVGKGIPVAYEVFEGEGHGFRRAENRRRVIEAEYAFFARVFGIDAPGLVDVAIANANALA